MRYIMKYISGSKAVLSGKTYVRGPQTFVRIGQEMTLVFKRATMF